MRPQYIETDEYGTKTYHSDEKMTNIHREDGPAREYADGDKFWYIDGNSVTEEEHADYFNLPSKKTIKPKLGKKTNNG